MMYQVKYCSGIEFVKHLFMEGMMENICASKYIILSCVVDFARQISEGIFLK